MEYSPQYHALAFTDSHYGVGNEDYLYYTINNDVFDIAFDVSAFTNYNTGDIRYSKGGINVERNDISESDYEAYINELKPIEWKKLPKYQFTIKYTYVLACIRYSYPRRKCRGFFNCYISQNPIY